MEVRAWRAVAVALGAVPPAVALLGWALGAEPLTSVIPGWATMKANTAVALLLLGGALATDGRLRTVTAGLAATLALTALAEDALGWDLGIDTLVVRDPASVTAGHAPGRMAAATAGAIVALATSALAATARPRVSQVAAGVAGVIAWVALLGYACELAPLTSVGLYGTVSLPTAVSCASLSVAASLLAPTTGWVASFLRDDSSGALFRRLGPVALLLPALSAWLVVWGQRAWGWQPGFSVALAAAVDASVFVAILAAVVAVASREEAGRRDALALVREREARLTVLNGALLAAHEDERSRLARELHDELGQTTTAIGLLLDRDPDQARVLLQSVTQTVRRLSLDLQPALLDDLGLAAALRWLIAQWSTPIALSISGDRRTTPAVELAAYRIAQEALTNAARHAGGTSVHLALTLSDPIEVVIADHGPGFDPRARRVTIGLWSMEERARSVGGTLDVASGPGGTTIRATLPAPGRP